MNSIRRLLSFFLPLFLFVGLLLLLQNQDKVLILTSVVAGCLVIGLVIFSFIAGDSLMRRITIAGVPILFVVSGTLFFLFLEHKITQYATLVILPIMLWFYLEYTFLVRVHKESSRETAQKNISMYVLLSTLFFGSVVLFDVRFFYSLSLAWFVSIAGVFTAASFWLLFEERSQALGTKVMSSLAAGCIVAELSIAIAYWPHIPLVKAIVTTALIYGMMQIYVDAEASLLTPKRIFRISAIVAIALLATLLTAQWV